MALASPVAVASPNDVAQSDDAYQEAFSRGNQLFKDEKWAEARTEYQRAYSIEPNPRLLFNIGSTYRREGKLEVASSYYKRYLDQADPDDELRVFAEEAYSKLQQEIEQSRAREPEKPRKRPPAKPREAKRSPVMSPVDSAPESGDTGSPFLRRTGLALAIVGTVGLAWGGYEGWLARSNSDDITGLGSGTDWTPELQADFDRGQTAGRRAPVLLTAGIIGVAGGLAMYVLGRPSESQDRALTLIPVGSESSAGLVLSVGF